MKRILDPSFKYEPSHDSDIRRRFKRERARLKEEQKKPQNVKELRPARTAAK